MPLTDFRRDLLALIPPAVDLLAPTPSTAFVWPTENCSIGCAHCNFASLPRRPGQPSDLTLDPAGLVGWLVDAGARGLTLCGGGEPLDERDFCDEVVGRVGRTGLDFAVYTSGVSLSDPVDAAACVRRWARLRGRTHAGGFWVRLSMDPFHTERIGDAVLADWIRAIERYAPEWRVSLRGLRLLGDDGLPVLAGRLGAEVRNRGRSTRLVLPSGRSVAVERMGWVFDGRGTPELLARRGLRLPDADAVAVRPWQELVGRTGRLGRPLSRRLTVGRRHVDLEIHADTAVHVLEAQPFDARLRLDRHDWATMRDQYYRDPLVHVVAAGGLERAAALLRAAIELDVAPRSTLPFSIERIDDARVLDWLTAAAVLGAEADYYPPPAVALARARYDREVRGAVAG